MVHGGISFSWAFSMKNGPLGEPSNPNALFAYKPMYIYLPSSHARSRQCGVQSTMYWEQHFETNFVIHYSKRGCTIYGVMRMVVIVTNVTRCNMYIPNLRQKTIYE